ncbi:MAG: cyclic-di-AMP receptor [Clostridia bacterium]|nr:cyclic-di-AMP receptor [Clostridia bacterium]
MVNAGVPAFGYYKTEVLVGGATVFVTNVEQFEKF